MLDQEPTMARPAFVVNEALREKVWHLAGLGVPQDDIAKIVGCAPKTLRKRFRDELDRGVAEANAAISGCLFAAAKAGNIAAAIFWMKSRAHCAEPWIELQALIPQPAGVGDLRGAAAEKYGTEARHSADMTQRLEDQSDGFTAAGRTAIDANVRGSLQKRGLRSALRRDDRLSGQRHWSSCPS
jgi:hypothetical protein